MVNVKVRKAEREDCDQILELMKKLAEFEGYIDQFKVTVTDLEKLCIDEKKFYILVADVDNNLEGMLVYFFQPFTYDLSPWVVVKELFVTANQRGIGIGEKLMRQAIKDCLSVGGTKLKLEVLANNERAIRLYQKLGAKLETDWKKMSFEPQRLLS
ncbi:GNAT family N-acetyltransferase [Alteromonas sp. CYL-A6]|uniref:GNAT family N-acetyltransferase n=1 Tax=Alteromonas nitratireducens TaxID=3390813 RepID=UPI0034B67233